MKGVVGSRKLMFLWEKLCRILHFTLENLLGHSASSNFSVLLRLPRWQVVGDSIAFALGLATTLALLGVAAAFAGKAYGQIGQGLPVAASFLAIVMGLNLLEVTTYVECFNSVVIAFYF